MKKEKSIQVEGGVMKILNWLYNVLFGCKCNSFGYGKCSQCGKKLKRYKA